MATKSKSGIRKEVGGRPDAIFTLPMERGMAVEERQEAATPVGAPSSAMTGAKPAPVASYPAGRRSTAPLAMTDNLQPPGPITDLNPTPDQVREGAASGGGKSGSLVGITAHSVDSDGGAISYKLISDSSKGGFAIDAGSGVVSVKDPGKLDYETAAGHQHWIVVKATDQDGLFSTKAFTITLLDVNEKPGPVIDVDAAPSVFAENSLAVDATVGITAKAVDPDEGDSLTYSLFVDTSKGGFAIDGKSGVVTVKDPAKMDYENSGLEHQFHLTVEAHDVGGLSSYQTFTVRLTDADEMPGPIEDINAVPDLVAEDAAPGTFVGLTARSLSGGGASVIYSLSEDAGGRFWIDPATGVVSVNAGAAPIDYETAPTGAYTVTVKAADKGGQFTTRDFTIAVADRADLVDLTTLGIQSGFIIQGDAAGDLTGFSVATAGDINGDGFADLIVGVLLGDVGGSMSAGRM